ncbi:hypothetical protein MBLNU459_g3775t1 [Dothideomycetes sp. NU459]
MSSFFTKPASLKRKRNDTNAAPRQHRQNAAGGRPQKRRETRDESISGSDDEDEVVNNVGSDDPGSESSESEYEGEDAAGRRTRLAERYLENTRQQILAEGFDAKDIDAELLAERMGERLHEDTAESKGKIYRWIADDYDLAGSSHTQFRSDNQTITGVAACPPHIYTVTKDMSLVKWEMVTEDGTGKRKPKQVAYSRGNGKMAADLSYKHHTGAILCVAASSDGKFVATGGKDKKLIVWDAATLQPLRVFTHHRDAITSLAFRRSTNQLFSASKDRTIKIWSLDELAYVETLFGHQDEVIDIAALNQEICVSVGARDRTARYWRVVEESQLVFRGGGSATSKYEKRKRDDGSTPETKAYNEGCIDRVAMVDDETFITGSDNGSLSLWNIQKKKAVFVYPLAHGLEAPPPAEQVSAEADPENDVSVFKDPQPRWITALACLPFTNIIVSGSWDGQIRAWKISEDKRRLEALGPVSPLTDGTSRLRDGEAMYMDESALQSAAEETQTIRGVVNDLAIFEKGDRGKDGLTIVAVAGKEHRLGRWKSVPGKNYAMLFQVPKSITNGTLENGHGEDGDESS